jgi:hypothetical protein
LGAGEPEREKKKKRKQDGKNEGAKKRNLKNLKKLGGKKVFSPSISARSVDTMLECTWSCFDDLTGASPSISSKKMIEGARLAASSKRARSCRSASPTHLDKTSPPLRMKNETLRPPARAAVEARARATSVLPVPGGP